MFITTNTFNYKTAFQSKADHRRMRALSYVWSLLVTWQWWRSHHSIRHSRNPLTTTPDHQTVVGLPEADFGMVSMFGRTRTLQKEGPRKAQKLFHAAIVVCIAAQVLNKMSMMTTVRVGW